MKSILIYLLILIMFFGGAHLAVIYIPENATGTLAFIRNVAEYVDSTWTWLRENLSEPIQWVLVIGGLLMIIHGIRHASGLITALGINLFFLGVGWQVAKEVYSLALNLFHNPIAAALCVLIAGLVGASAFYSL